MVQPIVQPWHLAICDVNNTTTIVDLPPNASVLTDEIMELVRHRLDELTSKHWMPLRYMSTIEAGIATVEAILPRQSHSTELATHHYQRSPFLTAALGNPNLVSCLSSSDRLHEEANAIRLAPPASVAVGSKLIVFRVSFGDLRNRLEVCGIAAIGCSMGVLAGLTTGKMDLGVAVAAAWLQFAQLVWARQRCWTETHSR